MAVGSNRQTFSVLLEIARDSHVHEVDTCTKWTRRRPTRALKPRRTNGVSMVPTVGEGICEAHPADCANLLCGLSYSSAQGDPGRHRRVLPEVCVLPDGESSVYNPRTHGHQRSECNQER